MCSVTHAGIRAVQVDGEALDGPKLLPLVFSMLVAMGVGLLVGLGPEVGGDANEKRLAVGDEVKINSGENTLWRRQGGGEQESLVL